MPEVNLISITHNAEGIMAYCARVSAPQNQKGKGPEKLLRYCLENNHWSVFEMAHVCMEIETSRAISAQILRHRSFSFQEFSQRYADATQLGVEEVQLRRQDTKNRQNSFDDLDEQIIIKYQEEIDYLFAQANFLYLNMLDDGIAKECARMVLPMATRTRLYMVGSVRSWIHYLRVRLHPSTQVEHRVLAEKIRDILIQNLPIVAQAEGWVKEENERKSWD